MDLGMKNNLVRAIGRFTTATFCWSTAVALAGFLSQEASGQLFDNLKAFSNRLPVGDPAVRDPLDNDGPKGIASADLDGDGRPDLVAADIDGTVTVYFTEAGGKFSAPMFLQTGVHELRGIVCADFNGDGRKDIATVSPYAGNVYLFLNQGSRTFASATTLPAWRGARALAAGDFDGDGKTDLAVAGQNNGLRHYRGNGDGTFQAIGDVAAMNAVSGTFPQPYYLMTAFRPTGSSRDQVVATHDETNVVWILALGTNGILEVQGTIPSDSVHSMDVGAITHPIASGIQDLVTAQFDRGTIIIHSASNNPTRFSSGATQTINVPGGPRAVKVTDLDGDGWKDLVVVLRNFDRVLTYHNSNGVLVASTEMPVGKSPRELITADFNGDGHPDVAVMNNDSSDVSVLFTQAGQAGFTTFDEIYPVDGEVSGLAVFDFNGDGRDDVIQLHRASGEVSVRLAATNGLLGAPTFF